MINFIAREIRQQALEFERRCSKLKQARMMSGLTFKLPRMITDKYPQGGTGLQAPQFTTTIRRKEDNDNE
jgi:hypothetical protein